MFLFAICLGSELPECLKNTIFVHHRFRIHFLFFRDIRLAFGSCMNGAAAEFFIRGFTAFQIQRSQPPIFSVLILRPVYNGFTAFQRSQPPIFSILILNKDFEFANHVNESEK